MTKKNFLWHTLTAPHSSLPVERQRGAELLTVLLLLTVVTAVLSLCFQLLFLAPVQPVFLISQIVGIGLLLGVYAVSRTAHLFAATLLFIFVFDLFILTGVLINPPFSPFMVMFLIIPVFVTCLLGSVRQSLAVIGVNLLLTIVLLLYASAMPLAVTYIVLVFYFLSSTLILLFVQQHYRLVVQKNLQLEASESRLRTFIQEADDWIFSLDRNGRFISANATACHGLGMQEADILGKQPIDFIKPEDHTRVTAMINRLFNNKAIELAEVEVITPDGRTIWLEIRGRILMENNQVAGTIHIARNITERKRSIQMQQRLNWETTLLYEVSKSLNRSLDFGAIYDTLYDAITIMIDCELLVIYAHVPPQKQLQPVYARRGGRVLDVESWPPHPLVAGAGDGLSEAVLQREIRLAEGETAVLPSTGLSTPLQAEAALLLPLTFENEAHHLVQILMPHAPEFTLDDQRFWEALSQQTAVALANARLFHYNQREIQERRRAELEAYHRQAEAETLRQAAAILNSSLSLNVVLTRILEQLRRTIPYDSASVQQKQDNQLVIRAAQGFENDAALINCAFAITADLPNAHALRTLKPLAVANVRAVYPAFITVAPDFQAEHIISWLGVPLMVDETVLGMITVDRNEVRPFTDDEIAMAVTFANHASIALRNAHLYEEMESQNVRLEQAVAARTAALQRTTDQIEAIFNNSPDAILLLDTGYNAERVNPALETLFGYQADEVLGTPPFALATPESQSRFVAAFQTAVTTGTPQRLEITGRRKDQSLFDVTAALAPVYESHAVTAVVCSLHDISAFKEVERLKDDFVSNVSHELRTPIANLKLHNDLIKLNPQKQAIYLKRQEREIERLTVIIESLLRLSRLDQGHIEVNPTAVNLLTLAQQMLQDRASHADSHGLTLHLQENPDLPLAKADGRLLDQVLGIVLTNAITYTPPGGSIELSGVSRHKQEQLWVGLSIHDTGPGIAPDEQDRVFHRFYRGHAGRASGAPGTGLGLAIAQEIITLHQGEIELISAGSGQGTTFIIWLPAVNP